MNEALLPYLFYYLWACLGLGLGLIGILAHEDITKGGSREFGYNYKSGVSWMMVILISFPGLNLMIFAWWILAIVLKREDKKGGLE